MRTGCNLHKYLILYVVLSFIGNKHLVSCERRIRMRRLIEIDTRSDDLTTTEQASLAGNYSALAQRSDFETGDGEHGVTCFTCVNVSNNHICNQYAIDRPCKSGNNFCHTLHIMDPVGKTVMVNKKCANETECAPHTIGCYLIDNQKICIACCDEDYCNKAVPNRKSNAVFSNAKTLRQKLLDSYNDRIAKNKKLKNVATCSLSNLLIIGHLVFLSTLVGQSIQLPHTAL